MPFTTWLVLKSTSCQLLFLARPLNIVVPTLPYTHHGPLDPYLLFSAGSICSDDSSSCKIQVSSGCSSFKPFPRHNPDKILNVQPSPAATSQKILYFLSFLSISGVYYRAPPFRKMFPLYRMNSLFFSPDSTVLQGKVTLRVSA